MIKKAVFIVTLCSGWCLANPLPIRVQFASNTGSISSSVVVTATKTITNGDSLAILVCNTATSLGQVSSISQTGATYTLDTSTVNSTGPESEMWHADNVQGAVLTATVTFSGSETASAVLMVEYSNFANSSLDQTAVGANTGGEANTGTTAVTTVSTEAWVANLCKIGNGGTGAMTNSFTTVATVGTAPTLTMEYGEKIVTKTGTANTATSGAVSGLTSASEIVTYKSTTTATVTIGPTSCVNNTSVGNVAWTTPSNATDFSVNIMTAGTMPTTVSQVAVDSVLELEVQGSFQTNQSTNAVWVSTNATPASFPLPSQIYGGPTNLLGASSLGGWQLQRSDFGILFAGSGVSEPIASGSNGLLCQFQFTNGQLDQCATVNGITLQIYRIELPGAKCFPKGITVWTPKGFVPIQDLRVGDEVYANSNRNIVKSKIVKTVKAPDPEFLSLYTERGHILVSPEHRFFTSEGVRRVDTLHVGDYLIRQDGKDRITKIVKDHKKRMTYEVSTKEPHNYYANGFLVHNATLVTLGVDYSSMTVTYTPGGSCPPTMPPSLMTLGAF